MYNCTMKLSIYEALVWAVLSVLLVVNAFSQSSSGDVPAEWRTTAEATDYNKTSSYDETIAYSLKLDKASRLIAYRTYGRSGEGRDMPLLIAATGQAFTPAAARKQGKAVVLVQAGIHAGEIDGKDAGFALLRDIAITGTRFELLKDVVILFMPIYNVDGHENSGPHMRMNQNGPSEMGFRANATNLNLNRDYMKADAPETRAWLKLWNDWRPDLFIDCHVTDGADFRYNVTYEYAHFQEVSPAIKVWMDEHFDGVVVPRVEAEGNLLTHYIEFAGREVTGGIATFIATPRYATGYTALRNRPGLLIETHSLKPYKTRVRGTYDVLRHTIDEVGRSKASLFAANITADTVTVERGKTYDASRQFPLSLSITDRSTPFAFKGVEYTIEDSPISGGKRIVYGTKPLDITIPRFDEARVDRGAAPPLYYIIPPQWTDVIDRLRAHGIKQNVIQNPLTVEVESYRLVEPRWSAASFEGRVTLASKPAPIKETRTFPAGSVVVPTAQDAGNVVIQLLEPAGPDSFVYWGFFNSIFEQKEYGEGYVIEKVAREMLANDPSLASEFTEKLKDPVFAASAQARLRFFYERSPYYLKQKIGIYPVGRITEPLTLADR